MWIMAIRWVFRKSVYTNWVLPHFAEHNKYISLYFNIFENRNRFLYVLKLLFFSNPNTQKSTIHLGLFWQVHPECYLCLNHAMADIEHDETGTQRSLLRSSTILTHEEAVHRNPYSLRPWLAYLNFLSNDGATEVATKLFPIYERAVAALPGSYKLWYAYATSFRAYAARHHPRHAARRAALSVSARAARALRLSPVLWARYVEHLLEEVRLSEARAAIDAALRALPVTQHFHVWRVVADAYPSAAAPRTAAALFRRQAAVAPRDAVAPLCDALLAAGCVDDAVRTLTAHLADPNWVPISSSRADIVLHVARTAVSRAADADEDTVPSLLRTGIVDAPPVVAELTACLAEFHTRRGDFERARDVLEKAVTTSSVARDFSVVYDAYAQLETAITEAAIARGDHLASLHVARLEYLVERRPMLLSDVQLRQNPHNVHEWHRRARMFKQQSDAANVVNTYSKAVRAVDPRRATNGRAYTLWLAFADYYTQAGDHDSARKVLEAAVARPDAFETAEHLAAVWAGFAEMELRFGNISAALDVLRRPTNGPSSTSDTDSVVDRVRRSRRLWMMMVDIAHAGEDVDVVTRVHTGMLDARIASAGSLLSGTAYLEERRLFDRAFRLYDRAATALPWPEGLRIWMVYLDRAISRLANRHPERVRDLFETALRLAPTVKRLGIESPHPLKKHIFLLYADFELSQGSGERRALAVLARATHDARDEDCAQLFRLRIVRTAVLCGASATRPVYEEALHALKSTEDVAEFASRYASLEVRLGETDRARGIFQMTCTAVDTVASGTCKAFWNAWRDFETRFGSEDSLRDMMRRRRRVELDQGRAFVPHVAPPSNGISNMVRDGELAADAPEDPADASPQPGAQSNGKNPASHAQRDLHDRPEELTEADAVVDNAQSDADRVSTGVRTVNNSQAEDSNVANNRDGELEVAQKQIPKGLQRLMQAARESGEKRKREETNDDEAGGKGTTDENDKGDSTSALMPNKVQKSLIAEQ